MLHACLVLLSQVDDESKGSLVKTSILAVFHEHSRQISANEYAVTVAEAFSILIAIDTFILSVMFMYGVAGKRINVSCS